LGVGVRRLDTPRDNHKFTAIGGAGIEGVR